MAELIPQQNALPPHKVVASCAISTSNTISATEGVAGCGKLAASVHMISVSTHTIVNTKSFLFHESASAHKVNKSLAIGLQPLL